jgi:hypothetical protein
MSDAHADARQSPPSRRHLKERFPRLVPLVRLARLVANQFKYPVIASVLDWRGEIVGGPFQGMRLRCSGASFDYFEALGTHEQCLTPVVEDVIARRPEVVINVGAAFGYYALGFAYRCPGARVIAYEMDPSRADLIRKYRHQNRLDDRVEVRGECTVRSLAEDLARAPGAFVFMDVEGAEDFLLRPDQVPGLRDAEVLVELHEMFAPGVTRRLRERFAPTHGETLIPQTPNRKTQHYGRIDWLVRAYWIRMAAGEHSHEMAWLHLWPKPARAASSSISLSSKQMEAYPRVHA